MIDSPCFDQRLRPIAEDGIIERLDHVNHGLFVQIAFIGQLRIIGEKGLRFGCHTSCVEALDFVFGLFQGGIAGLVLPGDVQGHAKIHVVQDPPFGAVFAFRLFDDLRRSLDVAAHDGLFDQLISV